ncbi:hypothetical protein SI65_05114 [Aspergillus cristatus]|uniref:Uncharacterized protein n=1 Tax=Aspergillus cristatus TaxID=573508 RepID=A0A1E3BGT4_ASPCR|nr:hypothetical protein SI65_05114 [Aspergillus cristatus]
MAEELSNWRAEQQTHEGIYLERITNLEQEVSKLCTELTEARHTIQQPAPVRQNTPAIDTQPNRVNKHVNNQTVRQNTPAIDTQPNRVNKHVNNQTPKVREMSQQPRQEPSFADLAALLSTRPGGQEWQEVTKKKQKNRQIQAVAAVSQPDPTKLKPAKDSPKEAWRFLFHREGGKAAPRSEREDIILAIN